MRADCHILWRFSLPAFLSCTLSGPANWICTTYLANQDQGYKEVALINAAGQWRNFLIFLPMTMTSVLVPMFSSLYHEGKREEFETLLRRNMLINVGICLGLAVPLGLFARTIMNLYGAGFGVGVPVFLLTLSGTAVTAAANLFSRAMQATGRARLEMTFAGLWAVVLILGCLILIPPYKAVGMATAHVLAVFVVLVWQWRLVQRLFAKTDTMQMASALPDANPPG